MHSASASSSDLRLGELCCGAPLEKRCSSLVLSICFHGGHLHPMLVLLSPQLLLVLVVRGVYLPHKLVSIALYFSSAPSPPIRAQPAVLLLHHGPSCWLHHQQAFAENLDLLVMFSASASRSFLNACRFSWTFHLFLVLSRVSQLRLASSSPLQSSLLPILEHEVVDALSAHDLLSFITVAAAAPRCTFSFRSVSRIQRSTSVSKMPALC